MKSGKDESKSEKQQKDFHDSQSYYVAYLSAKWPLTESS